MKWISIKDKLPDDFNSCCSHDFVLVFSSSQEGPSGMYGIAQWYEDGWEIIGESGGFSCVGEFKLTSDMITHWMPLPEKPKDDECI